jgi:4-amino-4-deoxy-L-arabinose transferase-like glycosyltransferase
MREKWSIGLVLVLFGLLASLYALLTPPWEAPDEPSHYLYVKHVAENWRPPDTPVPQKGRFYEFGYITSLYEWHHPALYYTLNALALSAGQAIAPGILPEEFPPVNPLVPAAPSPHLFLPDSHTPFRRARDNVGPLLLRLMSVGLAMGTVFVAYRMAKLAKPESFAFALAVAGCVAFIPQFTFLSATINNDNLANLVSALTILVLLRIVLAPNDAPLDRLTLALGILLAAGLLTKLTLVFLWPLAGGIWLIVAIRRRSLRAALRYASLALLPVALLAGSYFLFLPEARAAWVHNSQSLRTKTELVSLSYLWRVIKHTASTFWGRFGWANLPISESLVKALGAITIVGIAITGGVVLGDRIKRRCRYPELQLTLVLLAAVTLNFAAFIRFNLTVYQPQGRFLFPTLAPLMILALLGAWRIVPKKREHQAAIGLIGLMLVINLYAVTRVLYPGYYQRPLPSASQNTSQISVGEITAGKTHGQSFVPRYDDLSRIDVMMATYARENHYPIVFHLRRAPDSPEDLVTLTVDASEISDNAYHTFAFAPIAESAGRTFYFFLESPQSSRGDAFTIWANPEDSYRLGTRYEDHQPVQGDLRFTTYSEP